MKYSKQILLAAAVFTNLISYATFFCRDSYQHNFSIAVNGSNQIRAENESCNIEDLSELLYEYFTTNMYSSHNNNERGARFISYTKSQCLENLKILKGYNNTFSYKKQIQQQNRLLYVMNILNIKKIRTLHPVELVSIKLKGKTTYNTYIKVLSVIKKNTNRIRDEISHKLFNLSYRKLQVNKKNKRLQHYLYILKVLFPERIAEYPVKH